MPRIKVAAINAEWMNDWFTSDAQAPAFRPTFERDGQSNTTDRTTRRLAGLIRQIDADVVAIEEAPSRAAEMALFIDTYLADNGVARYRFFLSDTGQSQKLALLYKPGAVTAQLTLHTAVQELIDPWQCDVDGDAVLNEYEFARAPLVVDVQVGPHPLRVIVMHTKSNFINYGRQLWENLATRQQYVVASLQNRRRISAEAMHTRRYLEKLVRENRQAEVIVLGDLNDGPGMDYFEELYLTHSVTDILFGSAYEPELLFAHAQHDVPVEERYTAIFDDFVTREHGKHLLLDHILLSPALTRRERLKRVAGSGRVHHKEWNEQVVNQGRKREDRPCDHRPVSVEIEF